MKKYAQLDTTGKCIGISFLSDEIQNELLIPLRDDEDYLGWNYNNGSWSEPEEEEQTNDENKQQITPEDIMLKLDSIENITYNITENINGYDPKELFGGLVSLIGLTAGNNFKNDMNANDIPEDVLKCFCHDIIIAITAVLIYQYNRSIYNSFYNTLFNKYDMLIANLTGNLTFEKKLSAVYTQWYNEKRGDFNY